MKIFEISALKCFLIDIHRKAIIFFPWDLQDCLCIFRFLNAEA